MGLLKGRFYDDDDDELDFSSSGGAFGLPSGTKKETQRKVSIFPNPTMGLLSISLPESISAVHLQVSSMVGQVVHDQVIPAGELNIALDSKPWESGLYLLTLSDADGRSVHKQTIVVSK